MFNKVFLGEDGKLSWTKVLAAHAVLLFWTVYIQVFMLGMQYTDSLFTFVLEVMILFIAPRPFQMGLGRLGSGIGGIVSKQKGKPLEVLKTPLEKVRYIKPCEGRITSHFRTAKRPTHHGIDIAKAGNVEVVSVADGVVVKSYSSKSYGETIIIQHEGNVQTLYSHLILGSRIPNGTHVKQGDFIGLMGNTGASRGQHLHFEMHAGKWNTKKSNAVNPITLVNFN
jgi:murein DD-endopeptidase MepM/ murein hydrolase activator NlpD